jgi:tagatose 6-phosphate kinase
VILIVGANSAWQKIATLGVLRPGEVNRITGLTAVASGKGANVLRTLKNLAEKGLLIGYAGGLNGGRFRRGLKREKMPARLQTIAAETRVCTTLIEKDGRVTEVIEPSPPVTAAESEGFAGLYSAALPAADLVVIAGSSPENRGEDSHGPFIRAAKQRGLPVLLDAAGAQGRAALESAPDILKINLEEFQTLSAAPVDTPESRLAGCREMMKRYGLRWIVISDGARGLEGYDGRSAWRAEPPAVRALNPIGSGDAVSAGIARAFLSGAGLREALPDAAALGTASCLSLIPGDIQPGGVEELRRRIHLRRL